MSTKLPDINGWNIRQIQDISEVTGGSTPSTNEPRFWNGEIPFVTPTDITSLKNTDYIKKTRRTVTQEGLNAISSELLAPGTILLTSRATLGEAAINQVPLVTNQGFANIKPKIGIDELWLLHYLRSQKKEFERLSSGSTFKEVSKTSIKHMKIPVPPPVEQRGIVEVLGTVDECIRLTDAVIERAETLKRGLMQQLLTRGIRHTEYKKTSIGVIPKSWNVDKFGNFLKLSSGEPRPRNMENICNNENEYPVYGGNGIFGYTSKTNNFNTTIIIGRVGAYCGAVHLANGKKWITDNALYLRELKKEINLSFLYYLLNHMKLNRFSKRSGQPLITQKIIENINFGLPPIEEQKHISSMLLEIDNYLLTENERKNAVFEIKKGLMQQLLSGKIRVELRGDALHRIRDG